MTPGPAKTCPGLSHSTISEKSSPCLGEGAILTHMAPDPARWQIRAEGVLLFGASERPSNHPGVDLDHPMCPKLEFWTPRIVPSHPRVVQGLFRGSEKQHPFRTDSPSGKIGRHMRQRHAIMRVWAHFSGIGAPACIKCKFFVPSRQSCENGLLLVKIGSHLRKKYIFLRFSEGVGPDWAKVPLLGKIGSHLRKNIIFQMFS